MIKNRNKSQHDENKALQLKLLNYSTAASLALTAGMALPTNKAQAGYACVTPTHSPGQAYLFEFDGDADPEFRISYGSTAVSFGAAGNESTGWNGDVGVAVIATGTSKNAYASALNSGVLISAGKNFQRLYTKLPDMGYGRKLVSSSFGPWANVGQRYLGLKLKLSTGNIYYGWARITINTATGSDFTVNKYCYNTTPNESIPAGQSPTAVELENFDASPTSPWKLSVLGGAIITSIAGLWVWARTRLLAPVRNK